MKCYLYFDRNFFDSLYLIFFRPRRRNRWGLLFGAIVISIIYFVCIFINFAVGFPTVFFAKHLHVCKSFPIFAALLLHPLFSLSFCTVFDLESILCLFSNVRRLARWTFFMFHVKKSCQKIWYSRETLLFLRQRRQRVSRCNSIV